jgi:hypothetical protein
LLYCFEKALYLSKRHSLLYRFEKALHSPRRFSAKLLSTIADRGVSLSQRGGFPLPYSRLSRQKPLLFYQVAPQLHSRG